MFPRNPHIKKTISNGLNLRYFYYFSDIPGRYSDSFLQRISPEKQIKISEYFTQWLAHVRTHLIFIEKSKQIGYDKLTSQ